MSEKAKLNIEGDTYVIPGEAPYNEAEIRRDGDWNDLVPFDDEAGYVSSKKISKESMRLIESGSIGKSILGVAA